MVEEFCLRILKEIGADVLAVVRFVVGVFAETIIELRWVILTGLAVMALLWIWMMHDPHRQNFRPYHVDPAPRRIQRMKPLLFVASKQGRKWGAASGCSPFFSTRVWDTERRWKVRGFHLLEV
ncbi:MAG: hypothetical protein ACOYM3_29020 [Terrimicrobiaceae bacterium]